MRSDKLRAIVVGGGAAGFFGAITCAQTHPDAEVTILEAGRDPLKKVRISGGGRCNVTHHCFEPALLVQNYPRGGKALRGAFSRFQPRDTVEWFESRGVKLKTESDGRMFPITDDSETIAGCLMGEAKQAGVQLRTGVAVVGAIAHPANSGTEGVEGGKFEILLKSGAKLECDRLLLTTGSHPLGYRIAKSLGHQIEPPVPSLFTFNLEGDRLKDLAGISVANAIVQLPEAKLQQTGPVLITHWGLSGPAALKLSAWGARYLSAQKYRAPLTINWVPQYNPETARAELLQLKSAAPKSAIAKCNCFALPRRLWERLLATVAIDPQTRCAEISKKAFNRLVEELTRGRYQITGKGVFKEEFVTCGGVKLKEVNFKTMESRCCPGLYFAGEILDIDGVTGGFNFQSAWTTSWLAGQAMGKSAG
ncbi:NAD(P)/FAD-dependent oxidoreductase [Phormidium sp. CCY1219]|uniref:NAD(P)/FAD-dependent oxidoreductase n=1 Tax=Phormidium sp. CCY1219 TaxID=2886104 RepID=UPI002D1F75C3|nr:NAD(P)/FAD-dependent oxidoreductase [Phormidium sp. CCY1219]MEB3830644.1 NAD(P)/FAD-dependent oxidoreductase [Phormidium sp. CCY1219]